MRWYDQHILPWLIDIACGLPMVQARRRALVPQARGRVLKPGGQFLFCEHGRSPDSTVASWQQRIEPLWKPLAGGCHLACDVPVLLRNAGLQAHVDQGYIGGPRLLTCHCWGQASKNEN